MARIIKIDKSALSDNDRVASENRQRFLRTGLTVVNVMGSPGAGKTALLVETLRALEDEIPVGVIVGDLATDQDRLRLQGPTRPVVQVNTVTACHLSAAMIAKVLPEMGLDELGLLIIENVGNLVCPSTFDLGEAHRVVVLSTPEGDDKPSKYPGMFVGADAVVINKIDLSPHVNFDLDRATRDVMNLRPGLSVFPLSCKTGEGLAPWLDWIRHIVHQTVDPSAS